MNAGPRLKCFSQSESTAIVQFFANQNVDRLG
jgi:hypothetical protein